MDRRHEGRGSFWWVAAACLLVACGGRSGELYNDSASTMTGGFGTGGGGNAGDGGNGGNGGDGGSNNFGGSGDDGGSSNFGGSGGDGGSLSFGGSGGIPFGGTGGGGSGGDGGSNNFGGSGGDGGSNSFGGSGGSSGSTTGGPLECLGCIAQSCPFLVDCVKDPTCYQRLLCTIDECFEDEPGLECFIECHEGDLEAALALVEALGCATMTCSDRCNFDQ